MVFPNSYLPTTSQPWGREVQKRIELAETAITRNETNNDARDTQLAASMDRLSTTVLKANESLAKVVTVEENVYYPGTTEIDGANIRANTIAANKISAGTLTGFTIQTAYSGARVVIGGSDVTNIKFYDSSEIITGEVVASSSVFNLRNVRGGNGVWGTGSRSSLELGLGSATIYLNNGSFAATTTFGVTQTIFSNTVAAYALSSDIGGVSTTGTLSVSSTSSLGGTLTVTSGGVRVSNPGGTAGSNYLQVPDTYVRNLPSTSGLDVYVASNGTYFSVSSSERFKQDITDYSVNINGLLNIKPVSFRYKNDVLENGDKAMAAYGFIAEDLVANGLSEYVVFSEDENGISKPYGISYSSMVVGLQAALKQMSTRIEALENK